MKIHAIQLLAFESQDLLFDESRQDIETTHEYFTMFIMITQPVQDLINPTEYTKL